jgi:hypothetical protein
LGSSSGVFVLVICFFLFGKVKACVESGFGYPYFLLYPERYPLFVAHCRPGRAVCFVHWEWVC